MNTWMKRAALAVPFMAIGLIGWAAVAEAAPTPTPTPVPTATATADAALTKNLTFLREEERLAHDVYTALAAKYPTTKVFANIANSEQRHYDSMGLLLQRYGLSDRAATPMPTCSRCTPPWSPPARSRWPTPIRSGSPSRPRTSPT